MFSWRPAAEAVCLARRTICRSASNSRYLHSQRPLTHSKRFLKVSEEVQDAVATGKPVVALETTIYTHGYPYPDNIALATRLESIVRKGGGVPATIGILNGVAHVGLPTDGIIELASSSVNQKELVKVSRRDLGSICGQGLWGKHINGGTTIAGTMVLAHLAGIRVFGTGGLGGVHRGGEQSMDISADLTELGRTPVAVISSGCKSFLDIPRTLEYLETEGVYVGTFADGRTGPIDFPAFFSRDSGVKAPGVIQDEAQAAAMIYAQFNFPLSSGLLLANPVPETHSIPHGQINAIVDKAVELAKAGGIQGNDNTPFVLSKIRELSDGKSVSANNALVESNVERATRVAVELAKLEKEEGGAVDAVDRDSLSRTTVYPGPQEHSIEGRSANQPTRKVESPAKAGVTENADILVAGALAIDISCDYTPLSKQNTSSPATRTSNPSAINESVGGVGHNVALAASYLGTKVLFCTAVGDDTGGRAAMDMLNKSGLPLDGVKTLDSASTGARTARYVAFNDAKRDLHMAMADMSIMELPGSELDINSLWQPIVRHSKPKWGVVDANWGPEALSKWMALCKNNGTKVALEPVSAPKSRRLFNRDVPVLSPSNIGPNHLVDIANPNRYELAAMHSAAREGEYFESTQWWEFVDALELPSSGSRERLVSLTSKEMVDEGIPQQSIQLLPFIPCIITKLGSQGVLLTQLLPPGDPRLPSADYAPYILSRSTGDQSGIGGVYMRLFPPAETLSEEDVVSVNGAGDALLGTIVSALALGESRGRERNIEDIIPIAQRASISTLKHHGGVSPGIKTLEPLIRGDAPLASSS